MPVGRNGNGNVVSLSERLDGSCIFVLILPNMFEIKIPLWHWTSLIGDVWFSTPAHEHNRVAGVWTTETQQEKHKLRLWQPLFTEIYPMMVCCAGCSREPAIFIAIKLLSLPPDGCMVRPVCYTRPLSSFSGYFVSCSVATTATFQPLPQFPSNRSVRNTGVDMLDTQVPEPKSRHNSGSNKEWKPWIRERYLKTNPNVFVPKSCCSGEEQHRRFREGCNLKRLLPCSLLFATKRLQSHFWVLLHYLCVFFFNNMNISKCLTHAALTPDARFLSSVGSELRCRDTF